MSHLCKFMMLLLLVISAPLACAAAELPNVLWITSEDNAAHWLGCYGNREAQTPCIDALAAESVLYRHAYSNAAVCAVARSTILNGAYAVTQGTQHMRSRHAISKRYKPYVSYLKKLGYYCTNNSKTDYNFRGNDKSIWDDCSGRAHYKHRAGEQPFFAVFNLTVCHESSLFPDKVTANRERRIIPQTPRLDPAKLTLPPHLPDLSEMRSDFAIYHDNVTAMDTQVGMLLDELKERGLGDDTVVFYYSDHGGPTPRGKRYLTDTGVRIPLLVHVPEKWRHLSAHTSGEQVDELVAFVDLAPTVLSLIGEQKPSQMQGRAFMGEHRTAPPEDDVVFLFADRFDEIIGMRRGITDGRLKYIRRFTPHLPAAPYSYYQFGMPSWQAWQAAWEQGRSTNSPFDLWKAPQAVEQLYDTVADPWEIENLANEPEYAERLAQMRGRLRRIMASVRDTGVIPESLFHDLRTNRPIDDYANSPRFDLERVIDLSFAASAGDKTNLPKLISALGDNDPLVRYWGAQGCLILGASAADASDELRLLLADPLPAIRVSAAHALFAVGEEEAGKQAMLAELDKQLHDEALVQLLNSLTHVSALDEIPQAWVDRILKEKASNEYVKRFATRLKNS